MNSICYNPHLNVSKAVCFRIYLYLDILFWIFILFYFNVLFYFILLFEPGLTKMHAYK